MSTFGGITWGGAGGDGAAAIVTSFVSDLLYHVLRLAQVTLGPERVPSPAQYRDAMRAGNRMLSLWNTDGLKVPSFLIELFTLEAGKKSYTMGPGGDFDTSRPQKIYRATLILSDGSRKPLEVVDVDGWSDLRTQDQTGEPAKLYNDRSGGMVTLYLFPQTDQAGAQLELVTWKLLERLESLTQEVSWPEGYEEAFVHNAAIRVGAMFGTSHLISNDVRQIARESLSDVVSFNAPAPTMACDGAVMPQSAYGYYDWQVNE